MSGDDAIAGDRLTRRHWLGLAAGAAIGVAGFGVAMRAAAGHDRTFAPGDPSAIGVAALRAGPEIRVGFIETGRASGPARRLVQGERGPLDAVFRVAVIDHPTGGRLLFSTGVAPDTVPGALRRVSNPFGTVRDVTPLSADVAADARLVVLPSLRWHHVGGVPNLPSSTRVLATYGEQWVGLRGPMPHRYAVDRDGLAAIEDRIDDVPWGRRTLMGRDKSVDVFDDGSVWLFSLKGASYDEVAVMVALASGRTVALVADTVFTRSQVTLLRPASPMLGWTYQRNRMQLLASQRRLHHADAAGLEVVPLLDGGMDLPGLADPWV